jgi:hypothetical protein
MLPFAEFAPDRADTDPAASDAIRNVLVQAKTYGPMPSLSAYSAALSERARGGILARGTQGNYYFYAGISDNLYTLSGTSWDEKSKTTDTYNLASSDTWYFLQFGDTILATNVGDPVQAITAGAAGNFADLSGSPPQASYIGRAAGFVVLAGIANNPKRVQWSAIEDATGWTAGTDLSDYQDLPIPGFVTGIAGDETGAFIATTSGWWRMTFLPGNRAVFRFDEIIPSSSKGDEVAAVIAPGSIVQYGGMVYYLSESGFAQLDNRNPVPIGDERVDRFFLGDVDLDFLERVQGIADPVTKNIFWRYRSGNAEGGTGTTDKVLAYSVTMNRWSYIEIDLQGFVTATTPGYTMDELETTLSYATVDSIPAALDSRQWKGGRPGLGGFGTDNTLGFFSGTPLEAVLETSDHIVGGEGRRAFVNGFRPVIDADGLYGQIGGKETHGDDRTWTGEAAQESHGLIPGMRDARLHRFRVRIPAATAWEHATGVEMPVGKRTGRF